MTLEHNIFIERDPETVFQYFIDIENLVLWMNGLEEIEIDEGAVLGIGATSKQVVQQNGIKIHFKQVITGFKENELFQAKMTSKEMNINVKYLFEKKDKGTIIHCYQEVKLNTFLLKAAKGIVKTLMEKTLASDFNQLKNILENE